MVIQQEAQTGENGKDDSQSGHYYVHKRVVNNRNEHFWVLLDDEDLDVKDEEEMTNEIKERNIFVSTLIYKRKLEY